MIEVVHEEVTEVPRDAVCVVATGPLTADGLAAEQGLLLEMQCLHKTLSQQLYGIIKL